MTLMMILHGVLAQAAARSTWLFRLEGRAIRLGADGNVQPAMLQWHGVSRSDLEEALRSKDVSLGEVALITLEPSGQITVVKVRPTC